MAKTTTLQDQHTAGAQSIGFDYQFYYFMYLSLNLKHGEKIGFEVKDDVHIDLEDGSTVLLQAKHSTLVKADGSVQNLTTLDSDMWKSLSNWATFIKGAPSKQEFLNKHSFILVTNKGEGSNDFINALEKFKNDQEIKPICDVIDGLGKSTSSKTIKKYIKNFLSLGRRILPSFFNKLSIETNKDGIIERIKKRLIEIYWDDAVVEVIYDSLYSNLQETKYLEIKAGRKFEISFEDFTKKFKRCVDVASGPKKLPIRKDDFKIPDNPEDQIFIKQLIDIGMIQSGSDRIVNYTTSMLKFYNNFTFWSDKENFILITEVEEFKNDSIKRWENEFEAQYRRIRRKVDSGSSIVDLEEEIKDAGCDLVDNIRRFDLSIADYLPLGVDFSNGHYYYLSNDLEIGWHFDWENKYKK
ncbi:ABC-three component system protein [Chryseobacterium sp.]|uniref:ABC-three component system protein n=1 Tax=Chryseobacterium sp. TaxID=1871047 RepID=UPI0024E2607B|nr:ABC-three component system protein [Chryseobacterium sp.]